MASSSSTFLLTGTTADVVALLTLGVTRAARKSGLPHSLAPAIAAGMLLWLGAAAILARSGVLSAGTASPPRWPLLPLTALATLSLLGLNPAFRRRLGVSFDQQDGSALGGWTEYGVIGAYADTARHAVKCAGWCRTQDVAWRSSPRTGWPGRSSSVRRGVLDGTTANSLAADRHGPP